MDREVTVTGTEIDLIVGALEETYRFPEIVDWEGLENIRKLIRKFAPKWEPKSELAIR